MTQMAHKPVKEHAVSLINLLVILLILAGFAIRLYDLKDPPLDFHASRQLRSAIISRAFFYQATGDEGSLLSEQAETLSQLERYEPPIMEWLVSRMDLIYGEEVFWTGRIFSSFFWAIGGLFIFLLGRKIASPAAGITVLLIYFFLPFSILASRSFQPDPWMCTWVVITAWLLTRWLERHSWKTAVWVGIAGGFTLLIKPFAGFFVGFMLLDALLASVDRKNWKQLLIQVICSGMMMLIPSLVYYLILSPARSGDFLSFWVVSLSGLVKTSGFYASWIAMLKGLTGLILPILGIWGVLLIENRGFRGMMIGWWIGYVAYGLFVPYQIMTHEYYSLILVPMIAISVSPVIRLLLQKTREMGKFASISAGILLILTAAYGGYAACGTLRGTDYSLEPVSWQRVGEAIPAGEPFVALTADYGMRLIYYGWRMPSSSWPDRNDQTLFELAGRQEEAFDTYFDSQTEGKNYFLVTAFSELERQPDLKQKLETFPVYAGGNGFNIYDLREQN